MTEKSIEEQRDEGLAVKEMMQNSPGWKVVKGIISELQERAFAEWGELDFDAKPEKVAELKFTKRILSKLMEEINLKVVLGEEATQRMEQIKDGEIQQAMFVAETSTDEELEKLSKPMSFMDRILRRQPEKAVSNYGQRAVSSNGRESDNRK